MSVSTSPSLLIAATEGTPVAWQQMVQIYGPMLYQWSRRAGLQPADAADVTQDALLSVHRGLGRFDPGAPGATFRGWLWTILRRRIADAARQRPDEKPVGSGAGRWVADIPTDPPSDAGADRAAVLQRAIVQLRGQCQPRTFEAFHAVVVEGRAVDEVAQSLGMGRWAVYKAKTRLTIRLRGLLEGLLS